MSSMGEVEAEGREQYEQWVAEQRARADWWPIHQPAAPDAPIPGRHWYGGCDPDRPRVDPKTGICESCGGVACPECGCERYPDGGCQCSPTSASCPTCRGTGGGTYNDCPTCDGNGVV